MTGAMRGANVPDVFRILTIVMMRAAFCRHGAQRLGGTICFSMKEASPSERTYVVRLLDRYPILKCLSWYVHTSNSNVPYIAPTLNAT